MPTQYDAATGKVEDVSVQVARLREQVEKLVREKVAPAVENAAERAEAAAGAVRAGAAEVSGVVRDFPLTAILAASALGFLIGRASR
jgi:ElaB/YqjD/DUF883 family membrane-anchored ribosome-binding protein